ncbi:MAG TPA: aminotransferase class I/II-fold pyridoxal phosphate-dependent enzyme [Candidatus Limnocylindrales bacterium]|nr:aminotransferase class I/II-fold pyridoxal phosphate-dependent enzyme [Candidatus Limnocylindrales bacterium]
MRIADFALERYFARWEFNARHLLCASDVEGYPMAELLALADDETRALWHGLQLGYTESTGHPLLRREIASLYESIDPAEVLTFAGAEEAVFCTMNVLLGSGDHAIVTWPGYQSLYEVARASGAEVTLHELHESNVWALDLGLLRRQLTPTTRLIVVNLPHNPTGMLADRTTFDGLVELAEEAGAHLLVDEVYRGLELDPSSQLPAGADAATTGVSLGVMSKSFALAGLRVGWLATHDRDLLDRVARFKDYTTICSSAPSEILAIIALRARDRVLARSRGIVTANLDRLDGFFDDWADRFSWVRPAAGSIGFPRLTVPGVRIDDWAAELVEAEGVLLLPGSQFGLPGNHFRIGFGRTDLPEALARLESFAERTLR